MQKTFAGLCSNIFTIKTKQKSFILKYINEKGGDLV